MRFPPKHKANQPPPVQHSYSGIGDPETDKGLIPGRVGELPALIAVMGYAGCGKTTFVNSASGSCLEPRSDEVRVSNEFELDGQRVVLIDTPRFTQEKGWNDKEVMRSIQRFLAESYPTGTKLAGIVYAHRILYYYQNLLSGNIEILKELCGDATLRNVVIMIHEWEEVSPETEELLNASFSNEGSFHAVIEHGAQVYRCTDASKPDVGALRFILGGTPVAPKVQQGPIDEGSGPEQILKESEQEAVDKKVEELRRELEEQKRRAQLEADVLKEQIAEMRHEKERIQQEMHKVKIHCQELEEQTRRQSQEETNHRTFIAESQSEPEEDLHAGYACLPLDRSSPQFANRLNEALHRQEYERYVQNSQIDDLVWFVDYLAKTLDRLDPSGPASRKCLRELGSICATHMTLPTSYMIPSHLLTISSRPFDTGGFGDVYRGTFDGSEVCVKLLRATEDTLAVSTRMFCKEAVMWKSLKHPNILPLLGATISPPQLVSAFMPAGNLSRYLPKDPNANRIGLLSEIAEGLRYLHSRNVIHGDLKGMNILVDIVDNIPHARIADFGIAIVTKNPDSIRPATRQDAHTPRWSAPEIFLGQNPTKESDVYSFAMVTIEVLSGVIPFSNEMNWTVAHAVLRGDRPSRPEHPSFTDDLWALIQRCWDQVPSLRPEILQVSQTFSFVSTN